MMNTQIQEWLSLENRERNRGGYTGAFIPSCKSEVNTTKY